MFKLQWLDSRVWVSEVQLTSSSSSARGRLGDGRTVRKLVVATTAGADDAMPARREKAIFGFSGTISIWMRALARGQSVQPQACPSAVCSSQLCGDRCAQLTHRAASELRATPRPSKKLSSRACPHLNPTHPVSRQHGCA
jgi:hypothetical protein